MPDCEPVFVLANDWVCEYVNDCESEVAFERVDDIDSVLISLLVTDCDEVRVSDAVLIALDDPDVVILLVTELELVLIADGVTELDCVAVSVDVLLVLSEGDSVAVCVFVNDADWVLVCECDALSDALALWLLDAVSVVVSVNTIVSVSVISFVSVRVLVGESCIRALGVVILLVKLDIATALLYASWAVPVAATVSSSVLATCPTKASCKGVDKSCTFIFLFCTANFFDALHSVCTLYNELLIIV